MTLFVFFGFNTKVQEGKTVQCPALQVSTNTVSEVGNIGNNQRGETYLNGVWQFEPAMGEAQQPPADGWGMIQVPGDWRREYHPSIPGIVKRGTGIAWDNFDGKKLSKAWYQKTINIPQNWDKRRIVLDVKRISTDALVFVNGIQCGSVNSPYGAVDISTVAKAGQEMVLSLLVTATTEEKETTVIMGPNEVYKTEANLDSRGLIGEVRLLSLPAGPYISDVFIQPSTRNKQIKLDIEVSEFKSTGPVELIAKMLNEKGKVEKEFKATANLSAKDKQIVQVGWNWEKPRLWDIEKPNLYTMQLQIKGQGIQDQYDQEFGFREFWIEGKKFYLNGTEIRLRPTMYDDTWASGIPEVANQLIDSYIWAGFNIAELWPWNQNERGKWHFREIFAECADRKGFPLMGTALNMTNLIERDQWKSPEIKQEWEQKMLTDLRRYRNHPSILLWATNANFFGHTDDQNPQRIGKKNIQGTVTEVEDKRLSKIVPLGEETAKEIKKYDPTRPVMFHQGATVGDIYALNSYLNMIPLQEREEWLSEWAKNGNMPYMVVEFGTPLHATMMRSRSGFRKAIVSEPLMTEFSAIYLGNQAYELETPAYRNKIRELFVGKQEYKSWHMNQELDFAPAFQKVLQLFNTNTWRSWRTMGITGGMNPWNDGHGWQVSEAGKQKQSLEPFVAGQRGVYLPQLPKQFITKFEMEAHNTQPGGIALLENNGPTLAWITGSPTSFTEKNHNFIPGQKLTKQAALLNDTRSKQQFSVDWQITVAGQNISNGQKTGNLEPAQTLFIPIEATLPKTINNEKIEGEIILKAKIGNRQHQDRFPFRVFNLEKNPPKDSQTLTVFDPVGKTSQMLQKLGYKLKTWDGKETSNLLIIGRESLSKNQKLPGSLENFLNNGGQVILFTQNPQWFQKTMGFRIAPHLSRRVFPIDKNHPIIKGLDQEDLRDWTGESTLTEAYPNTLNGGVKRNPHGTPWYGWHWGNRGAVSSIPIEKPHNSGWRAILQSEFDLAYTPLMELEYGKGRLILTTLDLEDHYALDPVPVKLTNQLINYAKTANLSTIKNQVVLIGSDTDAQKLDALGVNYTRSDSLPSETNLVIIGTDKNVKDQFLQPYLNKGGKIFFMPRKFPLDALGVRLKEVSNFSGIISPPKWPEFNGLDVGDLRSRTAYNTSLITSGGEIGAQGLFSRFTVGKGIALFSQMNPEDLRADENTYLRYTRWRQTRAIAQLMGNMGATFKTDNTVLKSLDNNSETSPNYYHPDYRNDFDLGDDPYRYYRW
ncbi:MAG TPA: sugar-binding domain-containing protein [Halomicronema sp.]